VKKLEAITLVLLGLTTGWHAGRLADKEVLFEFLGI